MSDDTLCLPGLSPVEGLSVRARFDGGALSSDGGALAFREVLGRTRITALLASCLPDRRSVWRVRHSCESMVRSRVLAIACGYEDCNDLDALRDDPVLKMACERSPDAALGLASQPTLSRFENFPDWRALARMGLGPIDFFCAGFRSPPRRLTLDIDDTADLAHGAQQLSLFSACAGGRCLRPIHMDDAATGKPVACVLHAGKRPSGAEAERILRCVVRRIRVRWAGVAITVRGDGHYGTPEVMDTLEALDCTYILGLPGSERLAALARPWEEDVAALRKRGRAKRSRRYFETEYAAGSRSKQRRVVARVEATARRGAKTRFVVTNIAGKPKYLYEWVYCPRGRMENMIKEHKLYTASDRTSCHRWEANRFRLFLHTAAYWLLWTLRNAAARRSPWRTATFETVRRAFIKIAARVTRLKTRIAVSMPSACPHRHTLAELLARLAPQGP